MVSSWAYQYLCLWNKTFQKKLGKLLGKITVNGFVPSKLKQKTEKILLNDVVEIGQQISFITEQKI